MKKIFITLFLTLFTTTLFAQNSHEIVEAVNLFSDGAIRENVEIKTPKDIKTKIRFVAIENKEQQRIGWYEFQIMSEEGSKSGYYKVEQEDLEMMIKTLKWMREIVISGDYRGDYVGAETQNGWMIWLPKGGGEDVHVSKLVENPILQVQELYTSVLANSFCDDPNMGVGDFLQSLIDTFNERTQTPVRRKKK